MEIKPSENMSYYKQAIFGSLKEAALQKEAQGEAVVDLSLGSPDLPPAEIVRSTLAEASKSQAMYGYTLGGTRKFNEAVANYYERRTNVILDAKEEVLLTMGSQEGLIHLPYAFCNEDDMVLMTNPAYVAYEVGIHLAKAKPYYMPLRPENNYLPDLTQIPGEIAAKAKIMILNLPGNPVPATPTRAFFNEVVRFAKKHQILVLHDAAYSEYYFTGEAPISFLQAEGAKDVGLEINSLSKSFSLAGARVAYLVGNKDAIAIMKTFKSNLDYGIFQPIQEAAAVALDNAEEITTELRKVFKRRYHLLVHGLESLGWEVAASTGGMFVWAKYPYELDDHRFVFEAIKQVGVVMVPGTVFGSEGAGYVRLALVQSEEKIKQALQLLSELKL